MAEISNLDVESASSQLKFYLALKELEKQNLLSDLLEQMNMKSYVNQYGADAAIEKMVLNFSTEGMKAVINNHPSILEDIHAKIDSQSLDDDFSGLDFDRSNIEPETEDFLKTTKYFESQFPDSESPTLKERLFAGKDALLGALGTDKGKVALNAVLLGVAVGTGGAGIMAAAKLTMAVAEMALKNPAVRELCGKVQNKSYEYLSSIGVPVDTISKGFRLAEVKIKDEVEKRPWLKNKAVPLLAIAATIGGVLLHQNFDSLSNLPGQIASLGEQGVVNGVGALTSAVADHVDLDATVDALKAGSNHLANFVDHPIDSAASLFSSDVDSSIGFSDNIDTGIEIDAPEVPEIPDVNGSVEISDKGIPVPESSGVAPETANQVLAKGDIPLAEKEAYAALDGVSGVKEVAGHAATALTGGSEHVVASGDSIWKITKGLLPEGASNTDIANGVKAFIEANPSVASHPNLIFPGDKLLIPDSLIPAVAPAAVLDTAKVLADVKLDLPSLTPEIPALDTSSLLQTTIQPNKAAAIILPDAALTVASEVKKAVTSSGPGLGS